MRREIKKEKAKVKEDGGPVNNRGDRATIVGRWGTLRARWGTLRAKKKVFSCLFDRVTSDLFPGFSTQRLPGNFEAWK